MADEIADGFKHLRFGYQFLRLEVERRLAVRDTDVKVFGREGGSDLGTPFHLGIISNSDEKHQKTA